VNVDSIGVKRDGFPPGLLVVDGHQHEVDIGFFPHGIVRQTAAQDGCQHRAVALHLADQYLQRGPELL
jgi:hypothetical protein